MKINHIALYCLDLEGMRQFFMTYFGCISNTLYHNLHTGLRTYILSFRDCSTRLEIMSRPEVIAINDDAYRSGYIHLSVSVGSKKAVDYKTKELVNAGYSCTNGPRTTGDGYYESCITGPEGILIEICV